MSLPNAIVDRQVCPTCRAVFRAGFLRCPSDGAPLHQLSGDPLVGETFADRYVIEECVGEGGMGRVYRARHTRVSRRFALKVLFGDLAADSRMRTRFAQEGEAAGRLSHRNVVSVVDFGETPERQLYLVMDYVEGRSLKSLIDEQAPFEANRAANLLRQLAAGLGHAHRRGLVHRDFKPDNVIIALDDEGEAPKILDFGIARIADIGLDKSLTTEGQVMGTPAYMSPEHATGAPIDARSDLFSLGVVLYEMLCGKLPFGGTKAELVQQNIAIAPPAIATRVPGLVVDSHLEAMAMRLMAKNPADRYPDSKAILKDIAANPTLRPELRQRAQTLDSIVSSDSLLVEDTKVTKLDPMVAVPSSSEQTVVRSPTPKSGDELITDATTVDVPALEHAGLKVVNDTHRWPPSQPSVAHLPPPAVGVAHTQLVGDMDLRKSSGGRRWLLVIAGLAVIGLIAFLASRGGEEAAPDPDTQQATVGGETDAGAAVAVTPADAAAVTPADAAVEATHQPPDSSADAAPVAVKSNPGKTTKRVKPQVKKKPKLVTGEQFIARYTEMATRYARFKAKYGNTADGRRAAKLYKQVNLSRGTHEPAYRKTAWPKLLRLIAIMDKYPLPKKGQK